MSFVFGFFLAGALVALMLVWGTTILTALICLPRGRRLLPTSLGLLLGTAAFGLLGWLFLTSHHPPGVTTVTLLSAAAGVLPVGLFWHRSRARL